MCPMAPPLAIGGLAYVAATRLKQNYDALPQVADNLN